MDRNNKSEINLSAEDKIDNKKNKFRKALVGTLVTAMVVSPFATGCSQEAKAKTTPNQTNTEETTTSNRTDIKTTETGKTNTETSNSSSSSKTAENDNPTSSTTEQSTSENINTESNTNTSAENIDNKSNETYIFKSPELKATLLDDPMQLANATYNIINEWGDSNMDKDIIDEAFASSELTVSDYMRKEAAKTDSLFLEKYFEVNIGNVDYLPSNINEATKTRINGQIEAHGWIAAVKAFTEGGVEYKLDKEAYYQTIIADTAVIKIFDTDIYQLDTQMHVEDNDEKNRVGEDLTAGTLPSHEVQNFTIYYKKNGEKLTICGMQ